MKFRKMVTITLYALSGQEPGAMMRAAATQKTGPTERGRWSVQHGLLGAQWMGNGLR